MGWWLEDSELKGCGRKLYLCRFMYHPFKLLVGHISQDSQPPCLNHVTSEYEGVATTNRWPFGVYCVNFSLSCLWITCINHYFIFVKKQMTSAICETLCCVCECWCLDGFSCELDRLIDWMTGWLIGWLAGWLAGWQTDRQTGMWCSDMMTCERRGSIISAFPSGLRLTLEQNSGFWKLSLSEIAVTKLCKL
jgi:hypothetical protein